MENTQKTEIAVIGGGCFWCTEAVFKMLRGVSSVLPGYAGGEKPNPSYEDVCGGKTGHAEVIEIKFDPAQVRFEDLLTVFFASHDPTTMNRQGNDVGPQYRSIILYTTPEQKTKAENFIKELNASNPNGKPIVTEIKPLDIFYEAENYHQNYFARNPGNSYCEVIINPKLEKVQEKFANLLADKSKQK
ncbi:MAG: peptide-methionine (S)-S-oxide reductase MsrA [Candidatus Pacebacteria bacterium]|nr:peptide-methionine (S)-S-oxide reductase MsrA [Candidatus Paceibacterota bacterium]